MRFLVSPDIESARLVGSLLGSLIAVAEPEAIRSAVAFWLKDFEAHRRSMEILQGGMTIKAIGEGPPVIPAIPDDE